MYCYLYMYCYFALNQLNILYVYHVLYHINLKLFHVSYAIKCTLILSLIFFLISTCEGHESTIPVETDFC